MNKRIFAFDMDGTLLAGGDHVLPETLQALDLAKENGHILAIATGRSYMDICRVGKEILSRFDYLVCNNGTYLYDVKNQKFITDKFVPLHVIQELIEVGKENETFFAGHMIDSVIRARLANDNPEWADEIVHEEWYRFNLMPIDELLQQLPHCQITQASLRGTKETINRIKSYFQKYSDIVDVHIAGEVYLDINPLGSSKMSGLEKIGKIVNISTKDMIAFGDSGNDLQMLEGVGLGICMENGTPEAKEAADEIIGNHMTSALAKKIKELIK